MHPQFSDKPRSISGGALFKVLRNDLRNLIINHPYRCYTAGGSPLPGLKKVLSQLNS